MEYQQIIFFGMAFAGCVLVLVRHLVSSFGGCGVCGTLLGRGWWVVFGALLGPEATGPFCSNAGGHLLVFLLFLLPVFLVCLSWSVHVGVWVVVGGGLVDGVVV